MWRRIQYENALPLTKNEKFYLQGKFMEDYEDDAPGQDPFGVIFRPIRI